MSDRRAAIVRLLRTRDEHLPEPRHRSETTAGFVHRAPARSTCEDCLANGKVLKTCETCGGRGYTEHVRVRDPYAENDVVLPFGLDGARHEHTRERDRQIEMLKAQTRPASGVDELADANAHPYGWELARKRMYRLYDYGALDATLELLRVADDAASRALHAVYVYGWQPEPSAGPLQAACERGLVFLDERLPERLRVPVPDSELRIVGRVERGAGDRTREIRDDRIRLLAEAGSSPAAIAAECHCSIRTVYNVVKEADAA